MNKCYFNGEFREYADLNLHVSDLLFQRGYGVFDFFRSRSGKIPWLDDYTDRLFNSIKLAALDTKLSKEDFKMIVHDLQRMNGSENGAFKVIISGGFSANLESVTGRENVIILNVPWKRPPKETFEKGVKLISCEYLRPDPEIKSLNYFNSLKLQHKMREYGAVDVLYYTDMVTEASRANVFFVQNGKIHTPKSNILHGITRKQVLRQFREIRTEDIESDRLYDFDEIFITSTSRDITPVVSVEGRKIGTGKPGKVTKELMAAFQE